jgi:hypothetical protein
MREKGTRLLVICGLVLAACGGENRAGGADAASDIGRQSPSFPQGH